MADLEPSPARPARPVVRRATSERRGTRGRDRAERSARLADVAALVQGAGVAFEEFTRVGDRLRGAADELGHALGEAWELARRHADAGGVKRGARLPPAGYVAIAAAAAAGAIAGVLLYRGTNPRGDDLYDGDDDEYPFEGRTFDPDGRPVRAERDYFD